MINRDINAVDVFALFFFCIAGFANAFAVSLGAAAEAAAAAAAVVAKWGASAAGACSWTAELGYYTMDEANCLRRLTPGPDQLFGCALCGYRTAGTYSLRRHFRVHTGEKPYECDVCGKRFSQRYSVAIHKRTHSRERPYACTRCGYRAADRATLKRHLQTSH